MERLTWHLLSSQKHWDEGSMCQDGDVPDKPHNWDLNCFDTPFWISGTQGAQSRLKGKRLEVSEKLSQIG